MAGDPQIELRVSRLENDSNAIYDLITEMRSTQQEHSQRFDAVDRRLDSVDATLTAVDRRLDSVDAALTAVDRRFDSVDATLAEVLRRLPEPS